VPFSYSTAIARISNLPEQLWPQNATFSQQFQRLNQVLDRVYSLGQWDGLLTELDGLTTTNGLLILPPQYKLLTALRLSCGPRVTIKPNQWKYSPSAPTNGWGCGYRGRWYAFEKGDVNSFAGATFVLIDQVTGEPFQLLVQNGILGINPIPAGVGQTLIIQDTVTTTSLFQVVVQNGVLGLIPAPAGSATTQFTVVQDTITFLFFQIEVQSGVLGLGAGYPTSYQGNRVYQLSGDPAYVDEQTFSGVAKLRYVYATDPNSVVVPDCFEGLLQGVRAFHWQDEGDIQRFQSEFGTAMAIYEADLGQVLQDEDMGRVTVEYEYSGGSIWNLL
jgi:hypothetical protein